MDIKNVVVLGQKYKVTSRRSKDMSKDDAAQIHGCCYRGESRIWINPNLDIQSQYRTLLHEMGHAVMYRNGLAFTSLITPELEEMIVETFSSMSYEFLVDVLKRVDRGQLEGDIEEILQGY